MTTRESGPPGLPRGDDPPGGATGAADREIIVSRVIDAAREIVFRAWTDPEQLPRWWGPRGFTATTIEIDVRPGGAWRFVMHGPDGAEYPQKLRYERIDAPERIVYSHVGGAKGRPAVQFQGTVTFDEEPGGGTRVTMRMVFPTAAERDRVVREFGAIEGGKQHLQQLAEHVAQVRRGAAERGTH